MGSHLARRLIIGFSFLLLTWGIIGVVLSGPSLSPVGAAAQEASSPLTLDLAAMDAGLVVTAWANFTSQWADYIISWARSGTASYWAYNLRETLDIGLIVVALGTVSLDRTKDKREIPLREQILTEITLNPGIHLRELHREIGCAMGALQYHLRIMESEGQVVSLRNGNVRHLFTPDFTAEERVQRLAAMARNPVVSSILSECAKNGLTTQAEISRTLDVDKSLISYYVSGLLKADILNSVKVFGRERPVILTEWARDMIDCRVVLVQ